MSQLLPRPPVVTERGAAREGLTKRLPTRGVTIIDFTMLYKQRQVIEKLKVKNVERFNILFVNFKHHWNETVFQAVEYPIITTAQSEYARPIWT